MDVTAPCASVDANRTMTIGVLRVGAERNSSSACQRCVQPDFYMLPRKTGVIRKKEMRGREKANTN